MWGLDASQFSPILGAMFFWPILHHNDNKKQKKEKKGSVKCIKGFNSHQYWAQYFSFGQILHNNNKKKKKKGVMCINRL
jgi:hypothetical protein